MKKKIYKTPVLKNFGSVALNTQSNGDGPASDNGNNMMAS